MLTLIAAVGCMDKSKPAGRSGGAAPVLVAKAHRKVVPVTLDAIGAVEPILTAGVRSQVTGVLRKVCFQEGHNVRQGDPLFEIDPRSFENALRSAEADLQKARVQLETSQAEVLRYRGLSELGMVSKEQFQSIQNNERTWQAAVLASEAAAENARLQLEFCSIRAPVGGRTGSLGAHEGDLIRANDANVSLVVVNQLSPIYVSFNIPQQYLATIRRFQGAGRLKVMAAATDDGAAPVEGELTFIDNAIDATTGTLNLKATFLNQSHVLWPGQFVKIHVTLASPEVLVVPSSAVQNGQAGQHVFVIKDDHTAELRAVTVERSNESEAVITKGLTEGETVVTEGQLRVLPGKPVEIKQPATGAPAAGAKSKKPTKAS